MRLDDEQRAFVLAARRAVLATSRGDGRSRLIPICFALREVDGRHVLYSPVDEKPKRSPDAGRLGRIRDVQARPAVSVLVDRWDEDWARLAWLRLDGSARVIEPAAAEHAAALVALRARYRQYAGHALERLPVVAVDVTGLVSWGRLDMPGAPAAERLATEG